MRRTLLPRGARVVPNPRRRSIAGRPLVCALILLAGCSGSGDHESSESRGRTKGAAQASSPTSSGTVEVKSDVQRELHLKIEPLQAASASKEIAGYGRVLDPAPLAAAVSEWASARAASAASEQESERVKVLQKLSTASERAVQAAEATAVRDRLLVQSIGDRIALSWGRSLSRRGDLIGLSRALALQDRVIVQVELPLGKGPSDLPRSARLAALTRPGKATEAEFLGAAPATDPQLQGQGFLFLTRGNPLNLTPGMAVSASLEFGGEPLRGVMLPESALVRYDTRTWVYVQKDSSTFVRTPVSLGPPLPGGWLITQGLRAADRVVTDGAQMLLSEELKPQTSALD